MCLMNGSIRHRGGVEEKRRGRKREGEERRGKEDKSIEFHCLQSESGLNYVYERAGKGSRCIAHEGDILKRDIGGCDGEIWGILI